MAKADPEQKGNKTRAVPGPDPVTNGDGGGRPEEVKAQAGGKDQESTERSPSKERDEALLAIERELAAGARAAAALIAKKAQAGDLTAAKMVLERIVPATRERRISLNLRPIQCVRDAIDGMGDLLKATVEGKITLDEARTVRDLITTFLAIEKDGEFDRRLTAIENMFPELKSEEQLAALRLARVENLMRDRPSILHKPCFRFERPDGGTFYYRTSERDFSQGSDESFEDFIERICAETQLLRGNEVLEIYTFDKYVETLRWIEANI